jgi:hypothetical protein
MGKVYTTLFTYFLIGFNNYICPVIRGEERRFLETVNAKIRSDFHD